MATKHTCVQGSSFAYDISCDQVSVLDTNWVGSWAIVTSLDDLTDGDDINTLASGPLAHSADDTVLELRILPADTGSIPVGSYYLVTQVVNASIGFSEEVMQDPFKITAQGIQ